MGRQADRWRIKERAGRGGFVRQSAAQKQTFSPAQVLAEKMVVIFSLGKTMPKPCPFHALFVPGSCGGGGLGYPERGFNQRCQVVQPFFCKFPSRGGSRDL